MASLAALGAPFTWPLPPGVTVEQRPDKLFCWDIFFHNVHCARLPYTSQLVGIKLLNPDLAIYWKDEKGAFRTIVCDFTGWPGLEEDMFWNSLNSQ